MLDYIIPITSPIFSAIAEYNTYPWNRHDPPYARFKNCIYNYYY